ncbi:MAG TPA: alpha/beta hydrolase [Desulfotomaculum sp.]|nr:MAG: Putative esterase of the alpha-beta hydrolase superfamily [Desulfotomaculum sp. 46_80]HAG11632.1 alpha/beta hydrolase [Desulfotomaculum sp.]HBY05095.1 alpha/beta hydrolase [Desulfotomaculum sp.]
MAIKADSVFEGGGVKGIGLVGAVAGIEEAGYVFENMAGTSAGAIVAALLAVDYKTEEIKNELLKLDYKKFKDEGFLDKFGVIGKGLSTLFEYGIYEGKYFESWLGDLLEAKGKTTFGQIRTDYTEEKYMYRLQVIATDITDHRLLVLPQDLKDFGHNPDQFSIAKAVRMSMSIPLFFEPVKIEDNSGKVHIIVDGGVLSNYPIWLMDDGTSSPPWPTFGFKLMEPNTREIKKGDPKNTIHNPLSYLMALVGTMIGAHDNFYISKSKGDYDRTIGIPTVINIDGIEKEIKTTYFDITQEESLKLYDNGKKTAENFLKTWDFEEWKKKYRQ